jgi:hypothetical protein
MAEMDKIKCGIDRPMRTLWDKEVLLMSGKFDFPALKPGHIYRFLIGDSTDVGCGDGYRIYINGKQVIEQKDGIGRRAGGRARGAYITQEFLSEFGNGPVTIAATTFLRYGEKAIPTMPPVSQGTFDLWMEEAKLPPLDEEAFSKAATVIPMLSSEWQAKQDPQDAEILPEENQFVYDGKFVPNEKLLGSWNTVAVVANVDEFKSSDKNNGNAPFKQISFKDAGATNSQSMIWSGDLLMDLNRYQALKITSKTIDGVEYLFIEVGGFSTKNPVGWKSPLVVMKRNGAK